MKNKYIKILPFKGKGIFQKETGCRISLTKTCNVFLLEFISMVMMSFSFQELFP
jgi:hypothetical protein